MTVLREVSVQAELGRLIWQKPDRSLVSEDTTLAEVSRVRNLKHFGLAKHPTQPTWRLVRAQTFWQFNTASGRMEPNDISYAWSNTEPRVRLPDSTNPRARTIIGLSAEKYTVTGRGATLNVVPKEARHEFPDNWEIKNGETRKRV